MSAFLTLDSVSAETPDRRVLFRDRSLSIGAERVGLVGRNGSGKSTLLRILAGDAEPATGTVRRSGSLGVFAQDLPEALTLAEALGVAAPLAAVRRVLSGAADDADFDDADWGLEARLGEAFAEAGLPAMALERTIGTLSGGERARVGIARLLLEAPDLLLLDEPTNNLDAAGRAAIGRLARDWRGGVIVASHDRELLGGMDRIVELTSVGVRIVGGGWSAFASAREAERDQAATEAERAEAALRAARSLAQRQREAKERRDSAGRAAAAKGSEPRLALGARAERAEASGGRGRAVSERLVGGAEARAAAARAQEEALPPLVMALPPSGLSAEAQVLSLQAVTVELGERRLGPWSLEIRGPERVAVVGRNGAGKSTLLKVAAGELTPARGVFRRVEGRVAKLDQQVATLEPDASVLANLRRLHGSLGLREAYAACARFAFRNRDAERAVGSLSGGERLRAGLVCALAGARPPWLLVLDEPTNHLDIESMERLEQALRAYDGAILVASHDPAFLKAIRVEREVDVENSGT